MHNLAKVTILVLAILVWLMVFFIHGYSHVKSLTGQCCGYEGDPGFLTLFFFIFPGVYYFLALLVILGIQIIVLANFGRNRSECQ